MYKNYFNINQRNLEKIIELHAALYLPYCCMFCFICMQIFMKNTSFFTLVSLLPLLEVICSALQYLFF